MMRTFLVYSPIWVKFGVRDLHLILLRICEFRKNRLEECCTFLVGVNEISYIYACTMKPHDPSKVKNALVKRAHYVTEYNIYSITPNDIEANCKFPN